MRCLLGLQWLLQIASAVPTTVKAVVSHAKDELLAAAIDVARDEGLRQLSFGRVAKRAGTNDRTVVYYFPSKEQLVREVLLALSRDLESRLAGVGGERLRDHRELLEVAWPVLAHPDADAAFALSFEASAWLQRASLRTGRSSRRSSPRGWSGPRPA